jgi:hypothetical protein
MKLTPTSLKSFYRACLTVACALLLQACEVSFTNPLSQSLYTAPDVRLLGKWVGRDDAGNAGDVRVARTPHGEMIVSFERADPNFVFKVDTLKIDGSSYMALTGFDGGRWRGYLLAKYVIRRGRIKVWLVDEKKVRQAIREGILKGRAGNASYEDSTVTDTPQKILSYLKTAGDDAFKFLGEFERVDKTRKP